MQVSQRLTPAKAVRGTRSAKACSHRTKALRKWRRLTLALACLFIALCFVLFDQSYQAGAVLRKNKNLFDGNRALGGFYRVVQQGSFPQSTDRIGRKRARVKIVNGPVPQKSAILAPNVVLAGGDNCGNGTIITSLPFNDSGTTVGKADDYDLPPDVTVPTVTGCPSCVATGAGGTDPRGAVYTGSGTGPDATYKICFTSSNNSINVTMDPTGAEDLGIMVFTNVCSSSLADAIVIDDTGGGGVAESVTISNMPAGTYNIVVDGYSAGAVPPGPSGAYDISVTGTGTIDPTCSVLSAAVRTAWTSAGSTGAIDEDSTGKLTNQDFTVRFGTGQTGTATVRYNIAAERGISAFCPATQSTVNVRFRNSDTTGVHTRVKFEIHRTNIATGGNSIIYTFTSDGSPGSFNFQSASQSPNIDFDFANNIYWIEATLFRDDPALFADLGSIQIAETIGTPCP